MGRIAVSAALLALLTGASPASAHAYLDRATPRVGSAVSSSPGEVSLWFTEKLEPAFSKVEVRDSAGARVDRGNSRVGPGDRNVLRIGLKPLSAGTYKVFWRVLSVDTHTTEGSFSFRVGP